MHITQDLELRLETRQELREAARHYAKQPQAQGLARAYIRAAKVQKRVIRHLLNQPTDTRLSGFPTHVG